MKAFLAILLLLHGAIHIIGFLKGFQLAKVSTLTATISKPMGIFWGITTMLFLVTLIGLLLKKEFWPYLAFVAIFFSQILLILYWQDAKYGTLANVLILLLTLPFFGKQQVDNQITTEKTALLNSFHTNPQDILRPEEIAHLPPIVQAWLNQSGVVGKPKAFSLRLKQNGQLRTKPDSKWMSFDAQQYVDVYSPAFIWSADVKAFPGVYLAGRDRFENGTGEMVIKLASLIPVVDEKDNLQINTGSMIRFLAEICWVPSAAVQEYLAWEAVDAHSAKATLTWNNQSVNGIFQFAENGELISFEAPRFFGGSKDAQQYPWKVEMMKHSVFEGVNIPEVSRIIWKLPEGDFEWLRLTITELNYNPTSLFP